MSEDYIRRSSEDLKKILIEHLPKISKSFELKIYQRSQKESRKKLFKDLLKIFRRKSFNSNLFKFFSSKNLRKGFQRNSSKIFRRIRSREDLHERSSWDLIFQKISKKIWVLGMISMCFLKKVTDFVSQMTKNEIKIHVESFMTYIVTKNVWQISKVTD